MINRDGYFMCCSFDSSPPPRVLMSTIEEFLNISSWLLPSSMRVCERDTLTRGMRREEICTSSETVFYGNYVCLCQ